MDEVLLITEQSCITESIVNPIYKSGSTSDPNNYRGLLLLNMLHKISQIKILPSFKKTIASRITISKSWSIDPQGSSDQFLIGCRVRL